MDGREFRHGIAHEIRVGDLAQPSNGIVLFLYGNLAAVKSALENARLEAKSVDRRRKLLASGLAHQKAVAAGIGTLVAIGNLDVRSVGRHSCPEPAKPVYLPLSRVIVLVQEANEDAKRRVISILF